MLFTETMWAPVVVTAASILCWGFNLRINILSAAKCCWQNKNCQELWLRVTPEQSWAEKQACPVTSLHINIFTQSNRRSTATGKCSMWIYIKETVENSCVSPTDTSIWDNDEKWFWWWAFILLMTSVTAAVEACVKPCKHVDISTLVVWCFVALLSYLL